MFYHKAGATPSEAAGESTVNCLFPGNRTTCREVSSVGSFLISLLTRNII